MGWGDETEGVLDAVTEEFDRGPFVYRPADGSPEYALVSAILDEPHTELDLGGEAQVATVAPSLFVKASDLSAEPEEDDEVEQTSSGRRWKVIEFQPDGEGGWDLLLREAG